MLRPLPDLKYPDQHCDLWSVNLDEPDSEAQLSEFLSSDEKQRLDRFSNEAARRGFICSRGILRRLIGNYLGQNPEKLEFAFNEHGKPSLKYFPDCFFNISHSRDRLVLLFAPCCCGIDIECGARKVDFQPILRRFFAEEEIASWQLQPEPVAAFFRGWTRKEAFLKATGVGISGLSKVRISFAPELAEPVIWLDQSFGSNDHWFFEDFFIEPSYPGCIVLQNQQLPVHFHSF
ncbi:MAG: 4'-phosphopantetheinyl transferase superfamily protein [Candidatus Riflebacteria bacterium]